MFVKNTKCRIVYPENASVHEELFAKLLRYYLHSNYGYNLEIVNDSEDITDYEILIGNTNRTTSHPQSGTFTVLAEQKQLQLTATDMPSYEALYKYVTNKLLDLGKDACFSIPHNFINSAAKDNSLAAELLEHKKSSNNIRVMFYNIYGWTAQCGPIADRQKLQIELIKTYIPDIIACQEYSTHYSPFTKMLKEIGYEKVDATDTVSNYTPIFYDKERLNVVDSGYLLYKGPNDVNSKSATWAVLEFLENGKKFITISTHLMYNQPNIDANAARVSNAKEYHLSHSYNAKQNTKIFLLL